MELPSLGFGLFFIALVTARRLMPSWSAEKHLLLVASVAFYATWSVPFVLLIVATSLADGRLAREMARIADGPSRRRLLCLSIGMNVGLLVFFKYASATWAVVTSWWPSVQSNAAPWSLAFPPALSYFTFASLSYTIDVYYRRIEPATSPGDYTLFVAFFPKLMSGPITRARQFLPQLKTDAPAGPGDIEIGVGYFLQGAVKKLVIADGIAGPIGLIFAAPEEYDALTLLIGAVGFTVQLYCDFSGYSDMALGVARLLGFRLPDNFQMPLASLSVTEFWRRWHITLSQWFRDYVFLPLELATRDNPRPLLRSTGNMFATMVLCGMWHGASWNFVIWGALHGAALAVHKCWVTWNPLGSKRGKPGWAFVGRLVSRALTLSMVVLAMVFFRAVDTSAAFVYLHRLVSLADGTRLGSPHLLAAIAAVGAVHLMVRPDRDLVREWSERTPVFRTLVYSGSLLLLALLMSGAEAPFIYFQF